MKLGPPPQRRAEREVVRGRGTRCAHGVPRLTAAPRSAFNNLPSTPECQDESPKSAFNNRHARISYPSRFRPQRVRQRWNVQQSSQQRVGRGAQWSRNGTTHARWHKFAGGNSLGRKVCRSNFVMTSRVRRKCPKRLTQRGMRHHVGTSWRPKYGSPDREGTHLWDVTV